MVSRPFARDSSLEADLLVGFVNTLDFDDGIDALASPEGLGRWVSENLPELASARADPSGPERLISLRESLRGLLRANNGGTVSGEELVAFRRAAARSTYAAAVESDGRLTIEPGGSALGRVEARILLAIERLQAAGEWDRLKACAAGDCEWAFFDTSRNHSRTWCSMEVCGNREKTRRYRTRRR